MDVLNLLSTHHLRPTLPRVRILQLFDEETHLSPEAVYHRWAKAHEDLSLATVYRTFAELSRLGLLDRHLVGRQRALYTLRQADTATLLRCERCNQIIEVHDAAISQRQQRLAQAHGYTLERASLTLRGLCADCRGGKARPAKKPGL